MTTARVGALGRCPWGLAALVALRIFAASEAQAQSGEVARPTNQPAPEGPPPQSWYGYQTLVVDGFAALFATLGTYGTIKAASNDGSPSSFTAGISIVGLAAAGYLLGPPSVHWAHGRVAAGFESLALRVLAPVAGLGLGAVAAEIANGSKNQTAIPIGGVLGMVTASILDAAWLGWERAPDSATPNAGPKVGVSVASRSAVLGLGGTF